MLHKENYSFNTLTIRELELLVLGQQQAIPFGRSARWHSIPFPSTSYRCYPGCRFQKTRRPL